MCRQKEIDYVDSNTGRMLYKQPISDDWGGFRPSTAYLFAGEPTGDDSGSGECGNWSYNGSLTSIAGIDKWDNTPEVFDLITGQVTRLLPAPSNTGFDKAPEQPAYVGAYYAPGTSDLWKLKTDNQTDTDGVVLINPSDSNTGRYAMVGGVCDRSSPGGVVDLLFLRGRPTPELGCGDLQGDYTVINEAHPEGVSWSQEEESLARYESRALLPASDYSLGPIVRDPAGRSAVFVATQNMADGGTSVLFRVSASGGEPTKITDLGVGSDLPEVIAYQP